MHMSDSETLGGHWEVEKGKGNIDQLFHAFIMVIESMLHTWLASL